MNHEPDLITDKIKKLLRLAKSDNEHEAMLALANAAKLAAKHGVDLADLAEGEERPPITSFISGFHVDSGTRGSGCWLSVWCETTSM